MKNERDDPWGVLGVDERATGEEIREAYLRRVRQCPPDRDPDEFERIRDAYAELGDPFRRVERLILSADPEAPLVSLLAIGEAERRFVGLEPWLEAIEEERP